ncbi:MAG: hypothetical protein WCI88_06795, partial [Chloroflexota bacterium]
EPPVKQLISWIIPRESNGPRPSCEPSSHVAAGGNRSAKSMTLYIRFLERRRQRASNTPHG